MILSLNWLRDYLQKGDVKIDPKDLAEKMTMRGLPVASIKFSSQGLDNVVVGRIESIEKHPNADKLQVTRVVTDAAPGAEAKTIVCGAKNIAVGDVVPVALPGAVLPGDLKIKVAAVRGVESSGMLCSAKELGIADDAEGILQLPKGSALGEAVARLLGHTQEDTVLELELTPNRADCLSMIGIAREIAPLLRTKLREPKPGRFRVSQHRTSAIIKVEIDDVEACPRYVARVLDGIKVVESPDWIKQRLLSVGIRPINNVVDITNLVMMEYGQPLHAFDLRRIESSTIKVGRCKGAQQFKLLNGSEVSLQEGDILILDGERPIALAGIMGGENSQIHEDTTSIVLESATFMPAQIRRTAKRLGLSTDASKRFERGVDPIGVALASERAALLLRDSFNANVYHPPIDTNETGYKEYTLAVDMREIKRLTGMPLTPEQVIEVLESIGVVCHRKSINILALRIPSHRLDLRAGVDIVEEVARLVGYQGIPERTPVSPAIYQKFDESEYDFEQRAKLVLAGLGLSEAIHYSFTSEATLKQYGMLKTDAISLKNPITEDLKVLRPSLLPSLATTYIYNKNRKGTNQRLFEVARIYTRDESEASKVKETMHIAGLVSGLQRPESWKKDEAQVDFYFVKGLVDLLVKQISTVNLAYEPVKDHPLFHPARSATLRLGVRDVGYVGEIHPYLRDSVLETSEPVFLFELNVDALRKYERTGVRFKTPSKFPAVDLDLAFTVDRAATHFALVDTIRHTGGALLTDVSVFDVYQGTNIPDDKKSIAFHLSFQSSERTLGDTEIVAIREKITQTLGEKHGAALRA